MNRPLLALWPYWWWLFLPAPLLAVHIFLSIGLPANHLSSQDRPSVFIVALGATLFCMACFAKEQGSQWFCRLVRYVWRFETIPGSRVTVHFQPGLRVRWDVPALQKLVEVELDGLVLDFGFRVRHVNVFLFPSGNDVRQIFGGRGDACALNVADAFVLSEQWHLPEVVRHELVHVYASRWSTRCPALLTEGLATWLQRTWGGQPVEWILPRLLRDTRFRLPLLLDERFFFADPHRPTCYLLAGGFTGFLIRRFGWDRYRRLCQVARADNFSRRFKKEFGCSLEQMEQKWRDETLAMEVLKRKLNDDC